MNTFYLMFLEQDSVNPVFYVKKFHSLQHLLFVNHSYLGMQMKAGFSFVFLP